MNEKAGLKPVGQTDPYVPGLPGVPMLPGTEQNKADGGIIDTLRNFLKSKDSNLTKTDSAMDEIGKLEKGPRGTSTDTIAKGYSSREGGEVEF